MTGPIYPKADRITDIWRAALVAYRRTAQAGKGGDKCHKAGITAMREAFPELDEKTLSRHMIEAVAWATQLHKDWFYRDVPTVEWIWPPDQRGVGNKRWVNGRLVHAGDLEDALREARASAVAAG